MTEFARAWTTARGGALLGASWFLAVALGARPILAVGDLRPLLLALALGGALGWAGRERIAFRLMGTLLAIVLVVGFTPIVPTIGRHLVRDDGPQRVDAVAILGAGASNDGLASPEGVARMLSGFARVGAGDSTPITLSVIRTQGADPPRTTAQDLQALVTLVGGRRVVLLNDVFSTRDEATSVAALAKARGWQRVAVVTSPSHSSRACRTFEAVGLQVACWPSDERMARIAAASTVTERLVAGESVFYEMAGWLYYKARGWV